ncbi:hypothetical protein QKC54_gp0560 [Megavirus baoshan]|uniref:Uncharacterized protein n=1 Tax=Megavirus baoshan TaxID=2496520 RepID=A0A3S5HL92_9VIRU|nr:hypothetical protein QKC54_gp0560 [Megavirus baoshan]AZL89272.1 hypothetical protein Mb0512 [Megavirus baoshan]
MTDTEFNLTSQMEEIVNSFKIIHVYNKTKVYHLTRQVLLDSMITQNTYCFFCHILTKEIFEFNKSYNSFAWLIERSIDEADLYVNLNLEAFDHIVNYIQTSQIDGRKIYAENWRKIDEIIDLATLLGMSNLVYELRSLHPSQTEIKEKIKMAKAGIDITLGLCSHNYPNLDLSCLSPAIKEFIDKNSEYIENNIIKPNMYKENTINIGPLTEFVSNIVVKNIMKKI